MNTYKGIHSSAVALALRMMEAAVMTERNVIRKAHLKDRIVETRQVLEALIADERLDTKSKGA